MLEPAKNYYHYKDSMEKAKNRYHHESGEEQAKSYPKYNVQRFQEQVQNKYWEVPNGEKDIKNME